MSETTHTSEEQKIAEAEVEGFRQARVPFVFSTGYSHQSLRDGYRDHPILRKTFKDRDLLDTVTRLLAH